MCEKVMMRIFKVLFLFSSNEHKNSLKMWAKDGILFVRENDWKL